MDLCNQVRSVNYGYNPNNLRIWVTTKLAPWASYQIRKIVGCACAGNVSPRRRLQRKPLVSDPRMHNGTCVTHVPWCMPGSLTRGAGKTFPAFPAHAHPQLYVSARGPWRLWVFCEIIHRHSTYSRCSFQQYGLRLGHGYVITPIALYAVITHPYPNPSGGLIELTTLVVRL